MRNAIHQCGVCLLPAIAVAMTLAVGPALAHRFNVALVIPLSGAAAAQGRQFQAGFMRATAEQDSHPDQDSDGHLGGLDVYVRVIDALGDIRAELGRDEADIVAALGSPETLFLIGKILDGTKTVLLPPSDGSDPAARGYSAARRIGSAVRAQGGIEDTASLRRHFIQ